VHAGLATGTATGERNYEAELHRLHGELLRMEGREDEAKDAFLRALAIAREQGAALFELRATVGLGRLLCDLGRARAARRMLTRIYRQLQAGGECVDLQEARELLASLSSDEVQAVS
jgi:tetratricopeptide (TPR) repeat protein